MMKRLSRGNRRDSILNGAKEAFSRRGFLGTRALDVARKAHVSPGLLFQYFPSMRALQKAVLRRGMKRLVVKWPKGIARATPAAALKWVDSAFSEAFEGDPEVIRILLFGALVGDPKAVGHLGGQILGTVNRVSSMIRSWKRMRWVNVRLDPDACAWMFVSTMMQRVIANDICGIRKQARISEDIAAVFVAMLKAKTRSGRKEAVLEGRECPFIGGKAAGS
jgi:AcrR family transcriptional regulator